MQTLLQFDLMSIIREREDTLTVEALMVDLCGGHVDAGRMLNRLWMWWGKSGKEWIYKSWRDWWGELRISPKQIRAAHVALEAAGVERCVMKANGAPTSHYRLDVAKFAKRLNGLCPNGQMDYAQTAKSITIESTIKHVVVVEEQKPSPGEFGQEGKDTAGDGCDYEPTPWVVGQVGLNEAVARMYIRQYGRERVIEVCEYASKQTNLRNPAGFVVDELRTGRWGVAKPHPLPPPHSASEATAAEVPAALPEDDDEPLPPLPEFVKPQLPPIAAERDADMEKTWEIAYNQLALQFDRATFDTFLRRAQFAGRGAGGEYVFAVPNGYMQQMLQYRLYRNVRRIVADVSGKRSEEVTLRFEVGCVREEVV